MALPARTYLVHPEHPISTDAQGDELWLFGICRVHRHDPEAKNTGAKKPESWQDHAQIVIGFAQERIERITQTPLPLGPIKNSQKSTL